MLFDADAGSEERQTRGHFCPRQESGVAKRKSSPSGEAANEAATLWSVRFLAPKNNLLIPATRRDNVPIAA